MKKQVDKLIPIALVAVTDHIAIGKNKDTVNEAYGGYSAAYCTVIMQNGLLAGTAMFSDVTKTNSTKGDKTCLMKAIHHILIGKAPGEKDTFFQYVQKQVEAGKSFQLKRQILDATVAIKLALRTFHQINPKP